jgi:hypothetical protein
MSSSRRMFTAALQVEFLHYYQGKSIIAMQKELLKNIVLFNCLLTSYQ